MKTKFYFWGGWTLSFSEGDCTFCQDSAALDYWSCEANHRAIVLVGNSLPLLGGWLTGSVAISKASVISHLFVDKRVVNVVDTKSLQTVALPR